ncbi:MAG: chromate efflux transporter [Ardenticatenaceae bacterium]|nr:chromate efflux transporter [Ardenticatenaceae bacterium]MCB8949641.1 chromate efflux transporter [Ardenticatenaceae bacterium]
MNERLRELARLFFRLGLTAFGGPAAHIGMMEDEVVTRRQWLSHQHFLDLVGATSLIPGPNSTEMTMHIGYERAGWRGLAVAGSLFILPAAVLTGILAWLYVQFGTLPAVEPLLVGIKPAVIAIIVTAVYRLGRKAVKNWQLALIGLGVLTAVLLGVDEGIALLMGGVIGALLLRAIAGSAAMLLLPLLPGKTTSLFWQVQGGETAVSLWNLGAFFLKIGAILYGSGYVLVAYLEGGLVNQLGWLTQAELLDAIAIGQFTPGPVLTTATFVGYLIAGVPGAIVATLGIFLPSFLFVLLLNPLIPKMRQSVWLSAFLDAVNVAAVGLMVAVLINLGRQTLLNWQSILIALLALVASIRFKVNSAWIVLGGAILGYVLSQVG